MNNPVKFSIALGISTITIWTGYTIVTGNLYKLPHGGSGLRINQQQSGGASKLVCCQPMNKSMTYQKCVQENGNSSLLEECLGRHANLTKSNNFSNVDGQGNNAKLDFDMFIYTCSPREKNDFWVGTWNWKWEYTNNNGTHTETDSNNFTFTPDTSGFFTTSLSFLKKIEGYISDKYARVKFEWPGTNSLVEAEGDILPGGGADCIPQKVVPDESDATED